jgi:hypothetical protein
MHHHIDPVEPAFEEELTRATSEQEVSAVEHQGIKYEVKRGIGKDEWVWIIHTFCPADHLEDRGQYMGRQVRV